MTNATAPRERAPRVFDSSTVNTRGSNALQSEAGLLSIAPRTGARTFSAHAIARSCCKNSRLPEGARQQYCIPADRNERVSMQMTGVSAIEGMSEFALALAA